MDCPPSNLLPIVAFDGQRRTSEQISSAVVPYSQKKPTVQGVSVITLFAKVAS